MTELVSSPDITKLSVPQLRALCRDKKLTGYSKLAKAGLLQILGAVSNPVTQTSGSTTSIKPPKSNETPASRKAKDNPLSDGTNQSEARSNLAQAEPSQTRTLSPTRESSILPRIPGNLPVPSTTSTTVDSLSDTTSTENIPAGFSLPIAPRRNSHFHDPGTQSLASMPPAPLSLANSLINKPKRLCPAASSSTLTSNKKAKTARIPNSVSVGIPSGSNVQPASRNLPENLAVTNRVQSNQSLGSSGTRFKPLVIKKPLPVIPSRLNTSAVPQNSPACPSSISTGPQSLAAVDYSTGLCYLEMPLPPHVPALKHITMPPSLSQRKRVAHWALILSYTEPADRKNCCLVSRMFRYALYLSAVALLKRDFRGKRLDEVLRQYSPSMSNFWPYLRLRQSEVKDRHQVYRKSFFGPILLGRKPLSDTVWTSGDNQKQLTIALRFVLTRLWFAASVGVKEQDAWLQETVLDVQEVVPNQIWKIKVLRAQQACTQSLYVLDATCEVVGHAIDQSDSANCAPEPDTTATSLRADWTAFIQHHLANKTTSPLLTHLKWAHFEEYDKGISRFWLKRIELEGELGRIKRAVAEKYVLACVVANGVSGLWMSTAEMAQESAGLASRMEGTNRREPEINLFLPAHHHVESVHFTTAKRIPLHPAIAVVQTLHREYFVLRDNGMEIGCEEDGIRGFWMHLLRCSDKGLSL